MAYGKLTPPKKEMNDDFESEMMEEEMDMDLESDESDESSIASVLAPFSKEEIEEYLMSMDNASNESELDLESDEELEDEEYEDMV